MRRAKAPDIATGLGPRRGVCGMGVDDPAEVGPGAVQHDMRRCVRGRPFFAVDDGAGHEVDDCDVGGPQLLVGNAAGLDRDYVRLTVDRARVPEGQDDEACAREPSWPRAPAPPSGPGNRSQPGQRRAGSRPDSSGARSRCPGRGSAGRSRRARSRLSPRGPRTPSVPISRRTLWCGPPARSHASVATAKSGLAARAPGQPAAVADPPEARRARPR